MKNFCFLLFCLLVLSSCTRFFLQPDRHFYSDPKQFAVNYDDIWFESADGTRLHAWHLKNSENVSKPKGLLVFFHGNAQNISSHYFSLAWITLHGYDVLAADYRGYGKSEGEAEIGGVVKDSLAILQEGLKLHQQTGSQKLVIFGQSLGGILALRAYQDFSEKEEIDLLVLDSTFSSYKSMAWSASTNWLTWPLAPFVWLATSDKWSPKDSLSEISSPTLVIHSKDDRIVPFRHGHGIYEKLQVNKKWLWTLKEVGHIRGFADPRRPERQRFLDFLSEI